MPDLSFSESNPLEVSEQIQIFKDVFRSQEAAISKQIAYGHQFYVLDFSTVLEASFELAQLLLEKPEDIIRAAELALDSLDLPGETKRFRVRISNVPETQEILIQNVRSKHLTKLVRVEGIVKNKSDVRPQIVSARFECPSCGTVQPEFVTEDTFKPPALCKSCGYRGKLKLLSKDLVDAQAMVIEDIPEKLESGQQPKRINVLLKEDLVSPLSDMQTNPGSKIKISGWIKEVPVTTRTGGKSTRFEYLFEANLVEPTEENFYMLDFDEEEIDEIKAIAKRNDVYELLISAIAPSIYGHERIKEALVLQMLGGIDKQRKDAVRTRGDIHILLVGDPGSGKCVAGDTRIVLDDGSIARIEEIDDRTRVQALGLDGTMSGQNAPRFMRRRAPEHLLEIRTRSGSTLKLTEEHPLFTTTAGHVYARRADEFALGDRIALPAKLSVESQIQPVPRVKTTRSNNARAPRFPITITRDFAALIGYLSGDGMIRYTKTSGRIDFVNTDPDLLAYVHRLLERYELAPRTRIHGRATNIMAFSQEAVRVFERIDESLIKRSGDIAIPQAILRSPDAVLAAYLRALFDCEAHVSSSKREIEFSTKSKTLAHDLKTALLRFGIIASVHEISRYASNTLERRADTYHRVFLRGEHVRTYERSIGFASTRKRRALERSRSVTDNTNVDVVPGLRPLLIALRKTFGLTQGDFGLPRSTYQHYERGDRNPSRTAVRVLAERYYRLDPTHPLVKVLHQVSESDVYWDEIISIRWIKPTDPFVYDLEVDEVHNFVANNAIVHNSQMLKRASKVAPKSRYVSGKGASGAGLTASVVRNEFLGGFSLEAGALVLANKGMCLIDEMDKMSTEDTSAMHEALEQQSYHPDFYIELSDGSTRRIGKLVDELFETYPERVREGTDCEYLESPPVSLKRFDHERLVLRTGLATRVSRHTAPETLIRLTYANGTAITVTPEHPVLVERDGTVIDLPAEDVEAGMSAPYVPESSVERFLILPKLERVRITSIERVPADCEWVYDVTVEPEALFVTNGLVLHNTISISKANIQATLPSQTTVLAAANPKYGRFDSYQNIYNQIDMPPALISRFDLIFVVRDVADPEIDAKMASHILGLHARPEELEMPLSDMFLRKYFAYAKQHVRPVLTKTAMDEISDYYVKMRSQGSGGEGVRSIPLTARQLEALVRLAESSAKIRLSEHVTKQDAERAINLLHYCLTQVAADESGQIDIDRITSGVPSSQRSKIYTVKKIIEELEGEIGNKIPKSDIESRAADQNIKSTELDDILTKLLRSGDIYEPSSGTYSRLG